MPLPVAIRDLRKSFGTTTAVDGITIDIAPGELFFLLGPSGCGKTTLLRMVAGFVEPSAGRILFGDRDVTWLAANRRNTGMVFQSYALWPHMTVEANVAFGLGIRRIRRAERQRLVAEALGAVHMSEYARRKPNQLSGGQQQRIALARAMVIRPDVLLLDEPLSNLDARLRLELRSEIRRICKKSGITTVYVTHDQKEALSMADRIAIIDRGRLIQAGTPRELYRRPTSRFVAEFLGETNLLAGRVVEISNGRTVVETSGGHITAPRSGAAALGEQILCSVRPESMRLVGGQEGGTLQGRVLEVTYLGEMAQYTVALKDGAVARVASLNPGSDLTGLVGRDVRLSVSSDDVVLLPASP
jgi:iron(III) transport system ATP-binding protein